MGGGYPAGYEPGMPVAGFALQAGADAQTRRMQWQFEAEFENTVPSMEDLIRLREESDAAGLNVAPSEVLEMLSQGNVRFWTGQSRRPELNAMQRRAEIWQSYPKVAIIGCSDSRVPPEIIFDLGLGDVFVVRGDLPVHPPSPTTHPPVLKIGLTRALVSNWKLSLHKISFHCKALVWESVILSLPPPPAKPTLLQY